MKTSQEIRTFDFLTSFLATQAQAVRFKNEVK